MLGAVLCLHDSAPWTKGQTPRGHAFHFEMSGDAVELCFMPKIGGITQIVAAFTLENHKFDIWLEEWITVVCWLCNWSRCIRNIVFWLLNPPMVDFQFAFCRPILWWTNHGHHGISTPDSSVKTSTFARKNTFHRFISLVFARFSASCFPRWWLCFFKRHFQKNYNLFDPFCRSITNLFALGLSFSRWKSHEYSFGALNCLCLNHRHLLVTSKRPKAPGAGALQLIEPWRPGGEW